MTNREQVLIDEFREYLSKTIPGWNILKAFDISKWEDHYKGKPFVYVYDVFQVAEYEGQYEDSDANEYDATQTILCYIGYGCQSDLEGAGLLQIESRKHCSQIAKAGRGLIFDNYSDSTENVEYNAMKFISQNAMASNSNFTVGLSCVEFSVKGYIHVKEQNGC